MDSSNETAFEFSKQQLLIDIRAKYETYVPKLNAGLYGYDETTGIYYEVVGQNLLYDLRQIYNKMLAFKSLGYPALIETIPQSAPMVQITNTNENKVDIKVSFQGVRKEIEGMSALPDTE